MLMEAVRMDGAVPLAELHQRLEDLEARLTAGDAGELDEDCEDQARDEQFGGIIVSLAVQDASEVNVDLLDEYEPQPEKQEG